MQKTEFHQVIVVGAGPGGLSTAAALMDQKITDVIILEKGTIGQAWLDYPTDTHLLSETDKSHDDNMIAGIGMWDVLPNIPHPNLIAYQKYLKYVADQKKIRVQENTTVEKISYDPQDKCFIIECRDGKMYSCCYFVWAAGMYSTPNEMLNAEGCYIHYAHMPYLSDIQAADITVVGSANGASGVVMQLAKPGRIIHLVTSKEYVVPQPVDCLWKEHMQFIKDLERQGLVEIIEHFRVKRIYKESDKYVLESEDGKTRTAEDRPIICTGFSPNIGPVKELVNVIERDHGVFLDLSPAYESKKQPDLYIAGAIGKQKEEENTIHIFRDFGPAIAADIAKKSMK